MPVVVGVLIGIILLVAFSGWFYHLAKGWQEFVLDDAFFWYRIGAATLFSITIMTMTFFGMAYAYECPDYVSASETEGGTLSDKLNCPVFNKIKTSAEELLKKAPEEKIEEQPEEENSLESQTEEI